MSRSPRPPQRDRLLVDASRSRAGRPPSVTPSCRSANSAARPAVREPAGAVRQVGGEQRADARPVRRAASCPSTAASVAASPSRTPRAGSAANAATRSGQRAGAGTGCAARSGPAPARWPASARARPPASGTGPVRRRRDEVRDVALGRRRARMPARGRGPRRRASASRTQGRCSAAGSRVAQHAQAGDELPHRRDREARAREVREREFEDDHSAPAESIAAQGRVGAGSSHANPHLQSDPRRRPPHRAARAGPPPAPRRPPRHPPRAVSRYCVASTAALTFAWKSAAASASARDLRRPSALPRYGGGSLLVEARPRRRGVARVEQQRVEVVAVRERRRHLREALAHPVAVAAHAPHDAPEPPPRLPVDRGRHLRRAVRPAVELLRVLRQPRLRPPRRRPGRAPPRRSPPRRSTRLPSRSSNAGRKVGMRCESDRKRAEPTHRLSA